MNVFTQILRYQQVLTPDQFLNKGNQVLIQFSFTYSGCQTKVKESSLS